MAGVLQELTGGQHDTQVEAEEETVLAKAHSGRDAFARNNPATRATVTPIYSPVFMRKPPRHVLDGGNSHAFSIYLIADAASSNRIRTDVSAQPKTFDS